jgi:hypothetical protein
VNEQGGGFSGDVEPGRRMDKDFGSEEYRFKGKIISSAVGPKLIDLINSYDFSKSCKVVLAEIIEANLDPNVMLAINDDVESRVLKLQIALNVAVSAMDESDTANPGLLNVMQTIEDAFGDVVSRSFGGGERKMINKMETVNTTHYTGLNQQPERRGIQLPNLRRGQQ